MTRNGHSVSEQTSAPEFCAGEPVHPDAQNANDKKIKTNRRQSQNGCDHHYKKERHPAAQGQADHSCFPFMARISHDTASWRMGPDPTEPSCGRARTAPAASGSRRHYSAATGLAIVCIFAAQSFVIISHFMREFSAFCREPAVAALT